jgi:predicted membrane protein (TIGR00267 family)
MLIVEEYSLLNPFHQIRFYLQITHSQGIVRRYFVVNGFDGALTMLGLIVGFLFSPPSSLQIIINACMGATIALAVSGTSSAYVSEQAELRLALNNLQDAMVTELQKGAHAEAARWVPIFIALINGSAPLIVSLLIIAPLWLATQGVTFIIAPLQGAIFIAIVIIFLFGVFLGRLSGVTWLVSGIKTLLIAVLTMVLIYLFTRG